MKNVSSIINIRDTNDEVPDIIPEMGLKHPHLIYNGAPEDHEDLADLHPVRVVTGAMIA